MPKTLHCKVELMDRTQMVARLLSELVTARAAISASYLRLWRPAERALNEPDGLARVRDAMPSRETGAAPEERPPRDGG
jgi:hypothetical protein